MSKQKLKAKTIGIIGCGNMGEAVLSMGLKQKKAKFLVCEKDKSKATSLRKRYKVRTGLSEINLVAKSDIIIIAVKPQDINRALGSIADYRKENALFISVAAGIKTSHLESKIGDKVKIIRVMPNMPAVIGEGVTALVKGRFSNDRDLDIAKDIFDSLGQTIVVKKEKLIDAVTAISGSGPAYIFFIVRAISEAAKKIGLSKKEADVLIRNTIVGSMHLLDKSKFDVNTLISKVASKGGTTEAALRIFDKANLSGVIKKAVVAAHKRARELSR